MADDYVPNTRDSIGPVELQEYLFAKTIAAQAETSAGVREKIAANIRGAMRLQRFNVFNWLLMNGATIPQHLLNDTLHKPVGQQFPDARTTT